MKWYGACIQSRGKNERKLKQLLHYETRCQIFFLPLVHQLFSISIALHCLHSGNKLTCWVIPCFCFLFLIRLLFCCLLKIFCSLLSTQRRRKKHERVKWREKIIFTTWCEIITNVESCSRLFPSTYYFESVFCPILIIRKIGHIIIVMFDFMKDVFLIKIKLIFLP